MGIGHAFGCNTQIPNVKVKGAFAFAFAFSLFLFVASFWSSSYIQTIEIA